MQVVTRHFRRDAAGLTRMRWGFDADTWCVEFADGDKIVVQHRQPEAVERIVVATDFLDRSGVPVPGIVGQVVDATGSYLMFRWVEGEPGALALTNGDGSSLATAMGRCARRLRRSDAAGLGSDPVWIGPVQLRAAAATWQLVLPAISTRVHRSVAAVAGTAWTARPCHGDFAPVNAILGPDGRLTLLDLVDLADRHPLIDVAWWGLVVRHHHPDAFRMLFSEFAAAADCGAGDDRGILADVAVVRAWQSAAADDGPGRDHQLALLRSAVDWADEVHGQAPG